jgi:hypothetical protein
MILFFGNEYLNGKPYSQTISTTATTAATTTTTTTTTTTDDYRDDYDMVIAVTDILA